MKKLNDLKAERGELVDAMEAIVEEIEELLEEIVDVADEEELTEEEEVVQENHQKSIAEKRSAWNVSNKKLTELDKTIRMLEKQAEIRKNKVTTVDTTDNKQTLGARFMDFLKGAVERGEKASFRVEPMMSTSNTDILNKTVLGVDVLKSPARDFLQTLGVTIFTDVNGQLVLPAMEEHVAAALAEGVGGGDASLNITDKTLAPKRKSASQSVTREFLVQTNPAIYQDIIDTLIDSLWLKATKDFFVNIHQDVSTAGQETVKGDAIAYKDILDLEAKVGCFSTAGMKYVTSPTGRAYYKNNNAGSAGIKFVWDDDDTMNGYPAHANCAAVANKTYFGDWSKGVVAQWGGIELIVDPYTMADAGKIKITAISMFDSGAWNPLAFAINDGSIA